MRSFLLLLKYAKRKFEIDLILWEKNVVLAFFHVVAINQIFPPFATAKIQLFCFTASKMPIYFFIPAFCPTETTFHFAKTAFYNPLITRKPNSKGNTFCCSAQTLFNYTKYNNSFFCFGDYFMVEPFFNALSGETKLKLPSRFSAIKIIPLLSMPFRVLGARLTSTDTCLPTISSGL